MRDRVPCLESSRRPRSVSSSGVPGPAQAASFDRLERASPNGSVTNRSFSAKNEIFVPVFRLAFVEVVRGAATVLRYTVNSSKATMPSPSLSAAASCFSRNVASSAVLNALTSPTSRSRFRISTPLRLPSPSASYLSKTLRTSSREWRAYSRKMASAEGAIELPTADTPMVAHAPARGLRGARVTVPEGGTNLRECVPRVGSCFGLNGHPSDFESAFSAFTRMKRSTARGAPRFRFPRK